MRGIVERALRAFLETRDADEKLREIAKRHGALPVLNDMSAAYLLRPTGDVISVDWDTTDRFDLEVDPRIRNTAIYQGTRKYPELEPLTPTRTDKSKVCPHCDGAGKDPDAAKLGLENVLCYCGGLGWIPETDHGGIHENVDCADPESAGT
jgi:hypothetical protein